MTLAAVGFERYAKTTRRAAFLAEMELVVPWSALCALVEPFYPKPGHGRPPVGVERMLRIYFLQQWFNLSDPCLAAADPSAAKLAPVFDNLAASIGDLRKPHEAQDRLGAAALVATCNQLNAQFSTLL